MSLARNAQAISPAPPQIDTTAFTPAGRRRVSGPGLRTFLAIADQWGLNERERLTLLGQPSRSTFHAWAKAAREHREITLDLDILMRISAVLGIHKALQILHHDPQEGVCWLRGPHDGPLFGGQSPLGVMLAGTQDALLTVRRHLDAARGGFFTAPNIIDTGFEPYGDADIVFS